MEPEPRQEYLRRLDRWRADIGATDRQHLAASNLRLVAAAVFVAAFWLGLRATRNLPWDSALGVLLAWIALPSVAFALLAAWHARVLARGEHGRRAVRLYERGLARLAGTWAGSGPEGQRFAAEHPYARDLDLFGPGSLFQLLDTARTEAGEDTLAAWLKAPAAIDIVRARQTAVAELTPAVDLREDVAVLSDEARVGQTGALTGWASASTPRYPAILHVVLPIVSVITAVLIALVFAGVASLYLLLAWAAVQGLGTLRWRNVLHQAMHGFETSERDLALVAGLLERLERERFTSPRLVELQAAIAAKGGASRAIRRLRQLISWLGSTTHNLLFSPLTFALQVPQQLALAIVRWQATHGPAVADWLRAAGEIEALSALATYAYEHPRDPFPELTTGAPSVEADAIAHPLIAEGVAVPNNVSLGGAAPHVLIVSGSNMSGKSTLMRSVGVNAVLALAGAPVRARRLRLSPLAIGATIRVEDSLQEGHSRFYAEILRIRDIVFQARRGPTLFLLDEILHGTNSHDRRVGATAIVQALVDAGAIGLVTTHDLALTALVNSLGPRARNTHFEDRIEGERMVFDYRMRDGVVERSNALELMRAVGLDV